MKNELVKHLTGLAPEIRDDTNILASHEIKKSITREINEANIILLLISPDFVSSDACIREMRLALSRHAEGAARVVPVILRPTAWEHLLPNLKALPEDGKAVSRWSERDAAWVNVRSGLGKLIDEMGLAQAFRRVAVVKEDVFTARPEHTGIIPPPSAVAEMHYIHNDVRPTDTVIVLLNGLGLDHDDFRNYLMFSGLRCYAPTLHGFYYNDQSVSSCPMTIDEHCATLGRFLLHIVQELDPRRILLVGFSVGADLILWALSSVVRAERHRVCGALLLDPNINTHTPFISSHFARLNAATSTTNLDIARDILSKVDSFDEWVPTNEYLNKVFKKFTGDFSLLQNLSSQIVSRFPSPFPDSFLDTCKATTAVCPNINIVLSRGKANRTIYPDMLARMGELAPHAAIEYDERSGHFDLMQLQSLDRRIMNLLSAVIHPHT